MKLAFLYAGQGSQKPGMGQDFYDAYPQVRSLFDTLVMGLNLKELCFEAEMETLSQTNFTQPCMAAFGAAVTKLLKEEGITPDFTAGLSLGEYGALHAADVFDAPALLELLAYRGKVMADTTKGTESAMVAVFGMEEAAIQEAISAVGGDVFCCNFNCPGQIVIGGEKSAVEAAASRCKENGARRCIPLKVSGPFHTPLMSEASALLSKKLADVSFSAPACGVLTNVTGDLIEPGADIKAILTQQVKNPVRFENILHRLAALGVDTVIEIGPGKVLSGFVQKTTPDIKAYAIETVEDFKAVVHTVRSPV